MARRRSTTPALALCATLAFATLLLPAPGGARPGGGHTYHPPSHSTPSRPSPSRPSPSRPSPSYTPSHSYTPTVPIAPSRPRPATTTTSTDNSGGGFACGCVFFIFLLLLIAFLVWWFFLRKRGTPPEPPTAPPSLDLDQIRTLDPLFSAVLFGDFAYELYARAHGARGDRAKLEALTPYLSEAARQELANRPPTGVPVGGVIVGALRVVDLTLPQPGAGGQVAVVLEYDANMTAGAQGAERTQYVTERWRLVRGANVQSKPPKEVGSFHCPKCGAPFASAGGGRCDYCGEVVTDGRFDWSVDTIELLGSEDQPPALTGTTEEAGTDFPTIVHPRLGELQAELLKADPAAAAEPVAARLQLIYDQLNAGWTQLDLRPIRPFVSDNLFQYLQYWIDAYQAQGLRNVLEGMHITRHQLTKVVRDPYFDALTFRIWATGRDYTIQQKDKKVVGGRPQKDREYSEYWTLIRGASVRGAAKTDKSCPNCGGPLATNMAGECDHCGSKITTGDFDWVLSKIEQDDSYSG